jgi:hypothetical protein
MKKLLLASVLAIVSFPGYAAEIKPDENGLLCHDFQDADRCYACVLQHNEQKWIRTHLLTLTAAWKGDQLV